MAYLDNVYTVVQIAPTGIPTYVRLSQNENGRVLNFVVSGDALPAGSTVALTGTKPDGAVYSASGTLADNVATFNEDEQLTAVAGEWDAKLEVTNSGNLIATGRIKFVIDADPSGGNIPSDSQLDGYIAEMLSLLDAGKAEAYGSPLVASTVAGMIDQSRVYVYTGSETGYTAGNWYYWNGSAWTSGGVYNAVAVSTDTTLSIAGKAADAKATGDAIDELKDDISDLKVDTPESYSTYTTEGGSGTADIIKCTSKPIEVGTRLVSFEYYENYYQATKYLFVVNSNNVVVDKFQMSNNSNGWKTLPIGKSYSETVYLAVYANGLRLSYSLGTLANYWSSGLWQTGSTSTNYSVGDTITFTQNVPDRNYVMMVKINTSSIGVANLNNRLTALENMTPVVLEVGDGKDFTSFVDAIRQATLIIDRPVVINVYDGDYDIYDELGGDNYVTSLPSDATWTSANPVLTGDTTIRGIGNVILRMEIPDSIYADYEFQATRLSQINNKGSLTVENITFVSKNNRYAIHDECDANLSYNDTRHIFKNCRIFQTNAQSGIGIGMSSSVYEIEDCFITQTANRCLYAHAWYNNVGGTLIVKNTVMQNTNGYGVALGVNSTELIDVYLTSSYFTNMIVASENASEYTTNVYRILANNINLESVSFSSAITTNPYLPVIVSY